MRRWAFALALLAALGGVSYAAKKGMPPYDLKTHRPLVNLYDTGGTQYAIFDERTANNLASDNGLTIQSFIAGGAGSDQEVAIALGTANILTGDQQVLCIYNLAQKLWCINRRGELSEPLKVTKEDLTIPDDGNPSTRAQYTYDTNPQANVLVVVCGDSNGCDLDLDPINGSAQGQQRMTVLVNSSAPATVRVLDTALGDTLLTENAIMSRGDTLDLIYNASLSAYSELSRSVVE